MRTEPVFIIVIFSIAIITGTFLLAHSLGFFSESKIEENENVLLYRPYDVLSKTLEATNKTITVKLTKATSSFHNNEVIIEDINGNRITVEGTDYEWLRYGDTLTLKRQTVQWFCQNGIIIGTTDGYKTRFSNIEFSKDPEEVKNQLPEEFQNYDLKIMEDWDRCDITEHWYRILIPVGRWYEVSYMDDAKWEMLN